MEAYSVSLANDEVYRLKCWYKCNNLTRFHNMNAAIETYTDNDGNVLALDLYSYTTCVMSIRFTDFNIELYSKWDCSMSTMRHVTRAIHEYTGLNVGVNDIRRLFDESDNEFFSELIADSNGDFWRFIR